LIRSGIVVAHEPQQIPGLNHPLTVRTFNPSLIVDVFEPHDHRLPATAAVDLDLVVVHARRRRKNAADGLGSFSLFCHACGRTAKGRLARREAAKRCFQSQTGFPHGRPGYVVDHIRPPPVAGRRAEQHAVADRRGRQSERQGSSVSVAGEAPTPSTNEKVQKRLQRVHRAVIGDGGRTTTVFRVRPGAGSASRRNRRGAAGRSLGACGTLYGFDRMSHFASRDGMTERRRNGRTE
jgi:hypothetical protein